MKQAIFLTLSATALFLTSCEDQTKSAYYDLNKDEKVTLVKDEKTGKWVRDDDADYA